MNANEKHLKPISRRLFAIAAILLIFTFFFPIWQITLDAPQYPEGIGLHIWVSKITGKKLHDLRNINGLNHYIGMKEIKPESIPELKYMPWLLGFFILFGLAGAASNRRSILYAWIILITLFGIAGLIDFHLWNYDYGHNLDLENASIKIPGMSYQPPLIGSKKLLNFTANSWPWIGSWFMFASMALAMVAAYITRPTFLVRLPGK